MLFYMRGDTMEDFKSSGKKPEPMIHIMDGRTDEILDFIPLGEFWDDKHYKSLKDNMETFDFITFADKNYSKYLADRNRIIIPDEDGKYIEFIIQNTRKYRSSSGSLVIEVYSSASYIELAKANVIFPQTLQSKTAKEAAETVLKDTEWEVGQVDFAGIRTLQIEKYTNPYSLLKTITSEFDLELHFRVEIDGNKVSKRYIDLLKKVGNWQGREVEFGKDLVGIERKVDDSNIVTTLIGLGPESEDGNRLQVTVQDENALQRWGRRSPKTGLLMPIIDIYEPESTDTEMTEERLKVLTENELKKRINSIIEYSAEVADLEKVPGLEHEKFRLGDTIRIKDTTFNPPLYLEARIHTQERSISDQSQKKVTLGDYVEYTEEEVEAIWKSLQAQIAKKISMADVLKVTYTKEEIDEKDIPGKEAKAKIDRDVGEAIIETTDGSQDKADQAERNAKNHADSVANQARQEAITEAVSQAQQNLNDAIDDLEASIAEKADATWVNNQLQLKADSETVSTIQDAVNDLQGTASSLQQIVNTHSDELEAHGGKITKLETDYDELNGTLSAAVTELSNLGNTVSRHETEIQANAQAISLKANQEELDELSGTISDISSELTVMAGKIEAKAEKSELKELEDDVSQINTELSSLKVDIEGISTNVSNLSQTVTNHGTQISNINSTLTQHANLIASKVDATTYQQDRNGIITRIESAESRITQTENAIRTKVEQSEFDSVTNTLGNHISAIEQTADSISLEVSDIKANVYTKSEVDSAIDEIQVGGRNLLRNSKGPFIVEPKNTGQSSDNYNFYRFYCDMELNETYTISADIEITHGDFDKVDVYPYPGGKTSAVPIPSNGRIKRTFVKTSETINSVLIYAGRMGATRGNGIIIKNVKIEKGNKATDWTPAPEDIDEKFTDIEGTLASHSTKIEQNAQQIQLRATKAEVDTLSEQVNQAESQITQLAGQIELRATKTEVDTLSGRVSTVESTIQQHADMIESKIDDGQARSIFRQEASSFTFDADQINFKGHVFGEDATFTGRLEGAYGTFRGDLTSNLLKIGPESPYLPPGSDGKTSIFMRVIQRISDTDFQFLDNFAIKTGNGEIYFTQTDDFGFSTTNPKFNLLIDFPTFFNNHDVRDINMIQASRLNGKYLNDSMVLDLNNGNVSFNALGGNIFLGLYNTQQISATGKEIYNVGQLTLAYGSGFLRSADGALVYINGFSGEGLYFKTSTGWKLIVKA